VTPYPWLFWNVHPERKPYYLTEDQQDFLPLGFPIFQHGKSLTVTQYFPDAGAVKAITEFVANGGGEEFFSRDDWQRVLQEFVCSNFPGGEVPGRFETDDEKTERINHELNFSKSEIEKQLKKQVDFICWPGGANDHTVQDLARKAGYRSWTLDSRSQLDKRNQPGEDPVSIKRIGTSNQVLVKDRRCGNGGAYFQMLKILAHRRSITHAVAMKIYKLAALVRSFGGSVK
jgi:hypothetical protein